MIGPLTQTASEHQDEAAVTALWNAGLDHVRPVCVRGAECLTAVFYCLFRVTAVPDDFRGGICRQGSVIGGGYHSRNREEDRKYHQSRRHYARAADGRTRFPDCDRPALRDAEVGDEKERDKCGGGTSDQKPR